MQRRQIPRNRLALPLTKLIRRHRRIRLKLLPILEMLLHPIRLPPLRQSDLATAYASLFILLAFLLFFREPTASHPKRTSSVQCCICAANPLIKKPILGKVAEPKDVQPVVDGDDHNVPPASEIGAVIDPEIMSGPGVEPHGMKPEQHRPLQVIVDSRSPNLHVQ